MRAEQLISRFIHDSTLSHNEATSGFLTKIRKLAEKHNGQLAGAKSEGVLVSFESSTDADAFCVDLEYEKSVDDYVHGGPGNRHVFVSEFGDIPLQYSQW